MSQREVVVVSAVRTAIGTPVRTLVMSEEFHDKHKETAEKFMRCFVKATKTFIDKPDVASKYVRETLFNWLQPVIRGARCLDPFAGSGTTGRVAAELGRRFVGLDLSAAYLDLARARIAACSSASKRFQPRAAWAVRGFAARRSRWRAVKSQ